MLDLPLHRQELPMFARRPHDNQGPATRVSGTAGEESITLASERREMEEKSWYTREYTPRQRYPVQPPRRLEVQRHHASTDPTDDSINASFPAVRWTGRWRSVPSTLPPPVRDDRRLEDILCLQRTQNAGTFSSEARLLGTRAELCSPAVKM